MKASRSLLTSAWCAFSPFTCSSLYRSFAFCSPTSVFRLISREQSVYYFSDEINRSLQVERKDGRRMRKPALARMDESVVRRSKDEKYEKCNSVGLCSKRNAGHRSLMRYRLKKACDSLKSCPLPMIHPSEAQALNGFGPKTCERLEKRLREHCEENGLPMPKRKCTS